MTQRDCTFVFLCGVSFLTSSEAIAQNVQSVTIEVDASAEGAPLSPTWAFFGYDESNYTTAPEGQELLRSIAQAHKTSPYIRTHFLFNTGDGAPSLKWGSTNLYTEDDNATPVYDFTLLDGIMDATIHAGALPLFEIGFMPKALSVRPEPYENSSPYVLDGGSFYPPSDYEKWAQLVRTWAEHVAERYPDAEASWLWELWNEPDIGYFRGTFEEYTRLYDFTEAALHEVLPAAPLGGPAVVRITESFLADFLEHCDRGTNAVTGEVGTRLDFVTFHAKGGVTLAEGVRMNLGEQLSLHRIGFETVASSAFSDTPIIISEADPDGCAACPSTVARHLDYRNLPAYGAYEVAMMKRSLDLADEIGIDLQGVLTWAFTFPGTPYFSGHRALATNGIHLPVFNAFKLLAKLSGARVPVRSSNALPLSEIRGGVFSEHIDVDALAARDQDEVRVLVYHYHDDLVPAEPVEVKLSIQLPADFGDGASVTHQRVDELHGNAYTVWLAQGRPQPPSEGQVLELRRAMEAFEYVPEQTITVDGGDASLVFELPRFGVSLLTFAPLSARETESTGTDRSDAAGCSCQIGAGTGNRLHSVLCALLLIPLIRRRRVFLN